MQYIRMLDKSRQTRYRDGRYKVSHCLEMQSPVADEFTSLKFFLNGILFSDRDKRLGNERVANQRTGCMDARDMRKLLPVSPIVNLQNIEISSAHWTPRRRSRRLIMQAKLLKVFFDGQCTSVGRME